MDTPSEQRSPHLTFDQQVRLEAIRIREAVKRGREGTSASINTLIMTAFATCDRQSWIPDMTCKPAELWARLDQKERDAVVLYLGGI